MKRLSKALILICIFVFLFATPVSAKVKYTRYRANKVTAKQITNQLKKGFGIKGIKVITKKDSEYINEPNWFKSKSTFTDKKYPKVYATVEVFNDSYDAATRLGYVQALSEIYYALVCK